MEKETYKGYDIRFDDINDVWKAFQGGDEIVAENLSHRLLLNAIDKMAKQEFKRFDMYYYHYYKYDTVTITSVTQTGIWCSYTDRNGILCRKKFDSGYNPRCLYPITKNNKSTVEKIYKLQRQVDKINKTIEIIEKDELEKPDKELRKLLGISDSD